MRAATYLAVVFLAALGLTAAAFAGSTQHAAKWTCNYGTRSGGEPEDPV